MPLHFHQLVGGEAERNSLWNFLLAVFHLSINTSSSIRRKYFLPHTPTLLHACRRRAGGGSVWRWTIHKTDLVLFCFLNPTKTLSFRTKSLAFNSSYFWRSYFQEGMTWDIDSAWQFHLSFLRGHKEGWFCSKDWNIVLSGPAQGSVFQFR